MDRLQTCHFLESGVGRKPIVKLAIAQDIHWTVQDRELLTTHECLVRLT